VNLLRAVATISSFTFVSRVTGLLREMIVARMFGAGAEMDAFNVAFRLPNLLRRLFAEGAFSQAFVPILAAVRARDGEARTAELVGHVTSALFWTLLVVSIAGVMAAPALVWIMATGLGASAFELATLMTRWMFPYILFMSLVAAAAGVLNTYGRFGVPAFTPVLLNLSFIGFGLWGAPLFAQPVMALSAAVIVGGAAQLTVQLIALTRLGKLPRLTGVRRAFADEGVRAILSKMLPATFAVSVAQLSLIINTNIASHLGTGRIAWLQYADRLMEFPIGLLGVAMGTVLLPNLARANADANAEQYSRLLDWGLRLMCLIALPAAVGLGFLAEAVIAVLFHSGQFQTNDVVQTSFALIGYAVGLVGLVGVKILAPGFYARQDIRTPVRIAVGVLVATQVGNVVLVPFLGHAGLALSISLGACANSALLLFGLRRRAFYAPQPGWPRFLVKLSLALALLAIVLWFGARHFDWIALQSQELRRAGALFAVIGVGVATYFGALFLLGFRFRDFVARSS
jgi:putative peptidoglycan lipid II flippase